MAARTGVCGAGSLLQEGASSYRHAGGADFTTAQCRDSQIMVNYVAVTWAAGMVVVVGFALYALVYGWWW
jgi:hypothetical protein